VLDIWVNHAQTCKVFGQSFSGHPPLHQVPCMNTGCICALHGPTECSEQQPRATVTHLVSAGQQIGHTSGAAPGMCDTVGQTSCAQQSVT
jgi:hypothetical protein